MEILFWLIWAPPVLGVVHLLLFYLRRLPEHFRAAWIFVEFICMVLYPYIFFAIFHSAHNDCCNSDNCYLSPHHELSIIIVCSLASLSFFISFHKRKILPPLQEAVLNCLLLAGIAADILLMIQEQDQLLIYFNIIILLYLIAGLYENHKRYLASLADGPQYTNPLIRTLHRLLTANVFIRYPLLLLLCLPLLAIIAAVLLIFGQKPDSMIQAFTDTYHMPFSIHDCTNVQCPGGHYLCTIAAHGHEGLVRPVRMGVRGGRMIRVNRQLLVSNAFEEMLQDRLPAMHRPIRRYYDRVGDSLYSCQVLLQHRWISDMVYYVMKPAEWIFLLALYLFDTDPESRIARQYLSEEHKLLLSARA